MIETRTRVKVPGPTMPAPEEATKNLPATQTNGSRVAREQEPATQIENTTPVSSASFPHLAGAIAAVMTDLEPVAKEGQHLHFHFKYAKMQDILQMLTPLLGKHGLAIIPSQHGFPDFVPGTKYVKTNYRFTLLHKSGEVWAFPTVWTGLSLAQSEKGGFDDKCVNKCAVSARKSFLQALFNIPTEDADAPLADPDRGENDGPYNQRPQQRQHKAPSPRTGKVEPHELTPGKSATLAGWGDWFIRSISSATSEAEIAEWDKKNTKWIDAIKDKQPALYNKIVDAIEELTKAVAPVKQTDLVDPTQDPEGFIILAEKRMAEIKTLPDLEAFYNENIEPHVAKLFPPDQTALVQIFERRQNQLQTGGT